MTPKMTLIAVPALVLALAGLAGLAGPAVASAKGSTPTITVQDEGAVDGARVDNDGTVGNFKAATDGAESGPLMDAVPQYRTK